MSRMVWVTSLATVLIVGAVMALYSAPAPPLRSEHSRPAAHAPERMVAIVEGGKLFHDAACTYLHGKAKMVSASEAIRLGYTPCLRCMKPALAR
jgi:hypothetical protein